LENFNKRLLHNADRPQILRITCCGQIGIWQVKIADKEFSGHTVSMGNPHYVLVSDSPRTQAQQFGMALATHPSFPDGTNVAFVNYNKDQDLMQAVIYERGVGITQACGTGACAGVVVGQWLNLLPRSVIQVELPGGTLHIDVQPNHHVLMTGGVEWVFDGEINSDDFESENHTRFDR